jgi:N-acetylglucosaminyldiphosphoundecaprenol N-acetyl-beta-D-mannosaminyltransferase
MMGARWCGGAVSERVPGPDFFEGFLQRAARSGVSIFFLGSTDATLELVCEQARKRFPSLDIRGALSPPFGDFSNQVDSDLVAAVNRARPDALFVAMTAPKQELWLSRNIANLQVPFAMGVGAAFDFLARTKRRAPRALGRVGGEWLFRLMTEPRRLWRRNLDSAVFIWMIAADRMRRR